MRAAVTGGAGFIGSNLVDRLVASDADVLVLDDLSTGDEAHLDAARAEGAVFARVDVRDGPAVHRHLADFRPDVLFHLAAQVDVRSSMSDPAGDAHTNVVGSLNVLAAASRAGVRRVVNTSTGGAIYGESSVLPTPETEPARPLSAYGLGKHTVERYGEWFAAAHGLEVVTLRYGNVYGPRQDPRGDGGVIAIFCDRALAGRAPVVYGDGRQTRDFVFVGDIVTANLVAADAADLPHGVYNIGTGVEVDLLALLDEVARAAGVPPLAPEFRPARAGEVTRSCLDVARARAELALPPPTPLVEGLRATLDWMRDRHADGGRE
jgi:UDP-glucose 4-epimerase